MIFIDRNRLDELNNGIQPPTSWLESATDATKRAIKEGASRPIDRAIYGHNLARVALEKLFHFKCAYCESPLEETDWDVEHFRPKGRVAECRDHPGYYWLCYAWDNLYPSCKPCNERRRDRPIWGDLSNGPVAGKLDQFPLEDRRSRLLRPPRRFASVNSLVALARKKEMTLLIDPCWDTPDWYLSFDPTGQIFAIDANPYGEATIAVFNLGRRRLARKRATVIQATVKALRLAKDLVASGAPTKADRLIEFVKDHLASDGCYHSGAARAVIAEPDRFGV